MAVEKECCERAPAQINLYLAEALHPGVFESKQQYAAPGEKATWFQRQGVALAGLSAIRCRKDWKEVIVRSSRTARQHFAELANPKVSCVLVTSAHCRRLPQEL
jgi:hypothetical protein